MFSRKHSKNEMKAIRNAIRKTNKTYALENCPVRLEIYKWDIKSGCVLVIGYRTDRPKPDIEHMAMKWVCLGIFMKSNLYDVAYEAYHQC